MTHQHATLEDTVYFWFASNDTSGSGDDGASAAADVREAGATVSDAPVLSPTPSLLSHANFPDGCYEVAVAATAANGFAATKTYSVFATLAVDSQNPTGFIGSFTLDPMIANIKEINDNVAAAVRLALSAGQMIPFTVDAGTFTPTSTAFEADDITEATPDHYNSRLVLWTTGNLTGQMTSISDYELSGSNGKFTVVAMTEAPADNDTGILV